MEIDPKLLEKLNQVEVIEYFEHIGTACTYYSGVRELALQLGNIEVAQNMQFEVEAMRLYPKTPYGLEYYERRFDNSTFNIDTFPKEQLEYYYSRLNSSKNIFLKSRYADILFDYKGKNYNINKFEIGKQLVDSLFEQAKSHLSLKQDFLSYYDCIARSIEVCIRLGLMEQLSGIISDLQIVFENAFNGDKRWTLEASRYFYQIASSNKTKTLLSRDYILELVSKLSDVINHYWETKDFHFVRLFCGEIIRWHKHLKLDDGQMNHYLNQIGLSFEEEAIDQQGRKDKSNLVKAHFLENALNHYVSIGNQPKIDEMKVKIKQSYIEAKEKGEFEEHKIETELPKAIYNSLEERVEAYRQLPKASIIEGLRRDKSLIPNLAELTKLTESQNHFLHRILFQPTIVFNGNKVYQPSDDKEAFQLYVNENYAINMILILNFYLLPVFKILKEEKDLQAQDLLSLLQSWELMEDANYEIIEFGINRFFAGDYVSSLHILLPQLEACVRNIFMRAGYATTSIKRGNAQHEETFNVFLDRSDVKESLGIDLHKFLQFVLVEQTGYNLRNIFAHGLADINMCNEVNSILVIFIYIKLTIFRLVHE